MSVNSPPPEVEIVEDSSELVERSVPDSLSEEIDSGKPHVKISKFTELVEDEGHLYVQIYANYGDLKPLDELEAPSMKDAILTAYSQSERYSIPFLVENISGLP